MSDRQTLSDQRQLSFIDRVLLGPHAILRPSQIDALLKITEALTAGARYIFVQAPTGVGKSLLAWALGIDQPVTVLVNTHALGEQYRDKYGFEWLPGRHVFDCVHAEKIARWAKRRMKPTAFDCHYSPMNKCPYAEDCPYLIARERAIRARRLCVTYQYAIRSERVRQRPGIIVLDECHEAVETLLDVTETEVNRMTRATYGLSEFPYTSIGGYGENGQGGKADDQAIDDVLTWCDDSLHSSFSALSDISSAPNDDGEEEESEPVIADDSPDGAKGRRLKDKIKSVASMIQSGEWFLKSDGNALYLKSLDGRIGAAQLFDGKQAVVCMSATVGLPDALASEMGIEDYTFLDYPHPIPVDARPVFDLHAPKLTANELRSNPALYEIQARIIARWIRTLDPSWRGLIVTTSNYKVQQLRQFIGGDSVIGHRLYAPRGLTVAERVRGFLQDDRVGLISVDTIQGWGHGLDLRGDLARFTVVAGVPYKNPSDAYYRARIARVGGKRYEDAMACLAVVQADGRAKRGEMSDDGEYIVSYGALADGSCTTKQAMRIYPMYFKGAIR